MESGQFVLKDCLVVCRSHSTVAEWGFRTYLSFVDYVHTPARRASTWKHIAALSEKASIFRARGYQSLPIVMHDLDLVSHSPDVRVDGAHTEVDDAVMKPGMVLMLEPNPISDDGLLGLFLGQTFIITDQGSECITAQGPLDLLVVPP